MSELHVVKCPFDRCDGSGWLEAGENTARPCECRAQRFRETQMRRLWAGMPKRFRGVSLERKPICDLDPTLVATIRSYVGSIGAQLRDGHGLWLHGPNGTGKTAVAMLAARSAIEIGCTATAYSLPALLGKIRSTFDDSGGSYMRLFEQLTTIDLLVLDDLGAEKRTEWVLEQLYAIVNERWAEERAIVITTNLPDAALEEQLGKRTVSRLNELCPQQLHLGGEDLRFRLRQEAPVASAQAGSGRPHWEPSR